MSTTLTDLAAAIGAKLRGDGSRIVTGCNTLADADADQVSFLANPKYLSQVADSAAAAIIVSADDAETITGKSLLIADDPYFAFRQTMVVLHGFPSRPEPGISPHAVIDPSATLGEGCSIGPFVHVGAGVTVGNRTALTSHVAVGEGVCIGSDCLLHPNVTIYPRCVLGDRVTLHAGCSIGQDGYGYATHSPPPGHGPLEDEDDPAGRLPIHHKIPQAGIAIIEDDCEFGANCSVDRATMGATVVGAGTKLSNNVVIGHGSAVGRHNLLVAQVGLAGSVTTGDYVALGGQVGVAGHLTLGHHVRVAATSGVMNDIPTGETWGGAPAVPLKQAFRNFSYINRLPDLANKVKHLERKLAKLEAESREARQVSR